MITIPFASTRTRKPCQQKPQHAFRAGDSGTGGLRRGEGLRIDFHSDLIGKIWNHECMDTMDSIGFTMDIMWILWIVWIGSPGLGFRCFFFLFGVFGARRLRLVWFVRKNTPWDLPALENVPSREPTYPGGKEHLTSEKRPLKTGYVTLEGSNGTDWGIYGSKLWIHHPQKRWRYLWPFVVPSNHPWTLM